MPYVYFIQAVDGGPIKIGQTKDVQTRLAELQTGSPQLLTILAVIHEWPTEKDLHQRFAASRIHGEWFEPTPDLLGLIARIGTPDFPLLVSRMPDGATTEECRFIACLQRFSVDQRATVLRRHVVFCTGLSLQKVDEIANRISRFGLTKTDVPGGFVFNLEKLNGSKQMDAQPKFDQAKSKTHENFLYTELENYAQRRIRELEHRSTE